MNSSDTIAITPKSKVTLAAPAQREVFVKTQAKQTSHQKQLRPRGDSKEVPPVNLRLSSDQACASPHKSTLSQLAMQVLT